MEGFLSEIGTPLPYNLDLCHRTVASNTHTHHLYI